MDGESSSLDRLLNKSIEDPPITGEEMQARLAIHAGRTETLRSSMSASAADGAGEDEDADVTVREPLSDPPVELEAYPAVERPAEDGPPAEQGSPSLDEIAAELARRAKEFKALDTLLASQRISVDALDGRLRIVVTGHGQPVSLHVDQAAVKGPERRRLGHLIAELITTARREADLLQDELGGRLRLRRQPENPSRETSAQ